MCIKFSSNSHTEWDDLFQSKTILLPVQYLLYFDNGIHKKTPDWSTSCAPVVSSLFKVFLINLC